MRQLALKFISFRYNLLFILVVLLSGFYGCEDPHDRFDTPEWLKGDNIATLKENGNCNYFLALMDKSGYTTSIEKQLFTLFVPNDSAFKAYLNTIGLESIEELTETEAEELFGLHILINPRSRDQLLYEYAWGQLETDEGEYGSLFFRKPTYSVPKIYSEEVLYYSLYKGETIKITTNKTYIPFFTTEFFEDYFGDPEGSDYLFMYPGSSWSGTQWNDAMVTDAEVKTSSGFLYYIDRVVAPLPTIDKYIKDNPEFSLFYDIAQRFAYYTIAGLDENKDRVYNKAYRQILNFAEESGPSTQLPSSMLDMYTVFVPKNEVLQTYLDNTIFKYYSSIDSVPNLYWINLLQSHLNDRLNIKSRMEKRFKNFYGDVIEMDTEKDITTAHMCSNGVIYVMNKVLEPNIFSCVPGPIIYNKNYTTFFYAINQVNLLNVLANPDEDVTLFAPTNSELEKFGIIASSESDGSVIIKKKGSDGIYRALDENDVYYFVQDHYTFGKYDDLGGEGFIRMASDNYIYYNNSVVYGGGNIENGDKNNITEKIENERNGILYNIDNVIKRPENIAQKLMADADYSEFVNLLEQADLIDSYQDKYEPTITYPRVRFISETDQWTVFAPNNQAIADAQALGIIPTDIDSLRSFIQYHFIRENCVFDDGKLAGTMPTQRYAIEGTDIIYSELSVINNLNDLSVQDNYGQTINILHSNANTLAEFGVIHKISTCVRYN